MSKLVYKLAEDVYMKEKPSGLIQIIKLSGKDVIFNADLVAAEIISSIDGKKAIEEIIHDVSSQYDPKHYDEIRQKSLELVERLLEEEIISIV